MPGIPTEDDIGRKLSLFLAADVDFGSGQCLMAFSGEPVGQLSSPNRRFVVFVECPCLADVELETLPGHPEPTPPFVGGVGVVDLSAKRAEI